MHAGGEIRVRLAGEDGRDWDDRLMHIIQMAPYFPPYLGGQERFVFNLSRQLVRKGHAVTVLTSRYPGNVPARSEEEGIQVFRSRDLMRPLRNPISPGLLFPPQYFRQADVIHAHNEHSFASVAAVILGRRFGKPVLLTVHGRLVLGSRLGDFVVGCYEKTVSRMIFGAAAGITVATSTEKEWLCRKFQLPEARITVIPVGVDLSYWDTLRTASPTDYAWQPEARGKRVILVATQLIQRKGIDYLIRAMQKIATAEPDSILLIAGSGSEEASLRRLSHALNLDDRIRFLGRIFDAELSAVYRAADVFVLPSLSEGLATCVMEAWAHEKPVVATRIDGAKDSFPDVADLVAPADSDALAEGVLGVLRDGKRAAEKAKAGRRLMEEEYTWPVVAARMVSAYEAVIAGAGKHRR
jgi:glycosyltransferase involved in cell wall biosynthesis